MKTTNQLIYLNSNKKPISSILTIALFLVSYAHIGHTDGITERERVMGTSTAGGVANNIMLILDTSGSTAEPIALPASSPWIGGGTLTKHDGTTVTMDGVHREYRDYGGNPECRSSSDGLPSGYRKFEVNCDLFDPSRRESLVSMLDTHGNNWGAYDWAGSPRYPSLSGKKLDLNNRDTWGIQEFEVFIDEFKSQFNYLSDSGSAPDYKQFTIEVDVYAAYGGRGSSSCVQFELGTVCTGGGGPITIREDMFEILPAPLIKDIAREVPHLIHDQLGEFNMSILASLPNDFGAGSALTRGSDFDSPSVDVRRTPTYTNTNNEREGSNGCAVIKHWESVNSMAGVDTIAARVFEVGIPHVPEFFSSRATTNRNILSSGRGASPFAECLFEATQYFRGESTIWSRTGLDNKNRGGLPVSRKAWEAHDQFNKNPVHPTTGPMTKPSWFDPAAYSSVSMLTGLPSSTQFSPSIWDSQSGVCSNNHIIYLIKGGPTFDWHANSAIRDLVNNEMGGSISAGALNNTLNVHSDKDLDVSTTLLDELIDGLSNTGLEHVVGSNPPTNQRIVTHAISTFGTSVEHQVGLSEKAPKSGNYFILSF